MATQSFQGKVVRVVHQSQDFYILNFDTGYQTKEGTWYQSGKPTKVTGHLCGLDVVQPGMMLELFGKWVDHPKYGRQISVAGWKPWAISRSSVESFLECIPGFASPSYCHKLISRFGLDTFNVLSEEPEKVFDLVDENHSEEFITDSLLSWSNLRANYELSVFLQDHSINSNLIRSILDVFGPDSLQVISDNPYLLLSVEGFTFGQVDDIAFRMGVSRDDPRRLEGALLWVLRRDTRSGHLFTRRGDLSRLVHEAFQDSSVGGASFELEKDVPKCLQSLIKKGVVVLEPDVGVYLPEYHRFERESARKLSRFIAPMNLDIDLKSFMEDYQKSHGITLSEEQKEGVEKLAQNKVLVLTGLPGTGKTTLVRTFVSLFEATQLRFALMAPTGIAAKRLTAVTGHPAATIHRTFGYDRTSWGYNSQNQYPINAVILDEASMIDQELFYRVLDALDSSTILVMVGDDAQLPSVGPGNVLRELLSSPDVPNVRLTQIFRQAQSSLIIQNSHRINRGEDIIYTADSKSEFQFLSVPNEGRIVDYIVQMAAKLKSRDANFQVLSPKYDGVVGVNSLNNALRDQLNPLKGQKEARFGELHVREGDRVMVIQNQYDLNVYNGDMGKLLFIEERDLVVRVHKGGLEGTDSIIRIPRKEAGQLLRLAYCITVHKCVDPQTLVETPQGLLRAGNLPPEGCVATPTSHATYRNFKLNPPSLMLEIITKDGYRLRSTPNHGVDVWDDEKGYIRKESRDVHPGDFVRLRLGAEFDSPEIPVLPPKPIVNVRVYSYPIPTHLTEEVAEFLGLMVVDGTVYRRGFRLAKRHKDVADRFDHLCRKLFSVSPKRFFKNDIHHVEINSSLLSSWLSSVGGLSRNDRYIPECILRAPLTFQSSFLKGLFEDGSVIEKRGTPDHIELYSSFDSIIRDVRTLLLRFGIISGTSKCQKVVYIYGQQVELFRDKIGLIPNFKKDRLESSREKSTRHLVPVLRSEVEEILKSNDGGSVLTYADENVFQRGIMSRSQLKDFLSRMQVPTPAGVRLQERLQFHHSQVESTQPYIGSSVCIEVPEGNQYIQDGFCGWNSQGSEFDTVILPIVKTQGRMLQRNLLYTAVTRARGKVYLLGESSAVQKAIGNNKVIHRNTVLEQEIRKIVEAGVRADVKVESDQ